MGNEPAAPPHAAPAQAAPLPPADPVTPAAPPPYVAPAQAPPATYYPAAPGYPTPAYGYPPAPARRSGSRNLWVIITAVVVIVVLLIAVIAYVAGGYAFASSRISDAATAVNALNGHRGYVNTTFDVLGTQLTSFESMGDPKVGKSTAAQLATETQSMTTLVGADDLALAAARARLNDQQWLTSISSGRLAASAARISHARKAAANLKSAARDYAMLGQFFEAYYQALIDWETMVTAARNKDFIGLASANASLSADAAKALQLSTNAPGLPTQYHDFLVILQAYATDVAKELNSRTTADVTAANKQVVADVAAMNALDFTGAGVKIKTYYQHYRDDFNAELDKAII